MKLISGYNLNKNLCDGSTQTTFIAGSAIGDLNWTYPVEEITERTRAAINIREGNTEDVTLHENLYTYGNELYRLDGTEYIGYYHIHSTIGPMEGAIHSEAPHNKLKYYYHLALSGTSYKNKTRLANNFNTIYKSVFKIL